MSSYWETSGESAYHGGGAGASWSGGADAGARAGRSAQLTTKRELSTVARTQLFIEHVKDAIETVQMYGEFFHKSGGDPAKKRFLETLNLSSVSQVHLLKSKVVDLKKEGRKGDAIIETAKVEVFKWQRDLSQKRKELGGRGAHTRRRDTGYLKRMDAFASAFETLFLDPSKVADTRGWKARKGTHTQATVSGALSTFMGATHAVKDIAKAADGHMKEKCEKDHFDRRTRAKHAQAGGRQLSKKDAEYIAPNDLYFDVSPATLIATDGDAPDLTGHSTTTDVHMADKGKRRWV